MYPKDKTGIKNIPSYKPLTYLRCSLTSSSCLSKARKKQKNAKNAMRNQLWLPNLTNMQETGNRKDFCRFMLRDLILGN